MCMLDVFEGYELEIVGANASDRKMRVVVVLKNFIYLFDVICKVKIVVGMDEKFVFINVVVVIGVLWIVIGFFAFMKVGAGAYFVAWFFYFILIFCIVNIC